MTQADRVVASVKEETVDELQQLIRKTLQRNFVSIRDLQSLTGKLNNVARLISAWRPFLQELYAACTAAERLDRLHQGGPRVRVAPPLACTCTCSYGH